MTTLTKTFPNGTVSTWDFGRLSDGRFAAKSNKGKRLIFGRTLTKFDRAVRNFTYKYGYTKRSAELVKQLSVVAWPSP